MAFEQITDKSTLYVNDLVTSWASATTLTVGAGQCRDSLNNIDISLSAAVTIDAAVNGVNGLDTGSLANNTRYAVLIIADATKFNATAAMLSTSDTAPLLPTGYSVFRRIGWVVTDGSANILEANWSGNGRERFVQYDALISVLSAGAATSFAAIDLSNGMPTAETPVMLHIALTPNSAGNVAAFRPTGSSVAAGSAPVRVTAAAAAVVEEKSSLWIRPAVVSAAPQIDYQVSEGTDALDVNVSGYIDYL